jgi:hypothetical protein
MISMYVLFFLYSSVSAQGRNVGKRKIYHYFVTYVLRQEIHEPNNFHYEYFFFFIYRFTFLTNCFVTCSPEKVLKFMILD